MPAGEQSVMSDYKRKAWVSLFEEAAKKSPEASRLGRLADAARSQVKDVAAKAKNGITDSVPGADKAVDVLDASMQKALAGLHTTFVERGLNSVSPATIFATFASEGMDIIVVRRHPRTRPQILRSIGP